MTSTLWDVTEQYRSSSSIATVGVQAPPGGPGANRSGSMRPSTSNEHPVMTRNSPTQPGYCQGDSKLANQASAVVANVPTPSEISQAIVLAAVTALQISRPNRLMGMGR